MKRTTILLSEDLDARLRFEARRRGVSLADVAREAISAYLPERDPEQPPSFIGLGDGDEHGSECVEDGVRRLVGERHDVESSR